MNHGKLQHLIIDAPTVSYWNCNVYGIDFSPDGKWVVMGCGGWYGEGAISVHQVESGEPVTILRFGAPGNRRPKHSCEIQADFFEGHVPSLTISSVAFDGSGKYLGASSVKSSQGVGPAFLFAFDETDNPSHPVRLRHCATYIVEKDPNDIYPVPSGVGFANDHIVIRLHEGRKTVHKFCLPSGVDSNAPFRHRTHTRLGFVPVEFDRTFSKNGVEIITPAQRAPRQPARLLSTTIGGSENSSCYHHNECIDAFTAILALPKSKMNDDNSKEIISGDQEGRITLWRHTSAGRWAEVCRIRNDATRQQPVHGAWIHYRPQSVVALCALEDDRFFSVDASGEVLEWCRSRQDPTLWKIFTQRHLPRPATPRCMAVHPSSMAPWRGWGRSGAVLAVGVKSGDEGTLPSGERRGFVVCFQVETGWDRVGRFLLMRKLLLEGRATVDNAIDTPDTLLTKVLIDLEDDHLLRSILSYLRVH